MLIQAFALAAVSLVILNWFAKGHRDNAGVPDIPSQEIIAQVYPGHTLTEVRAIYDETWKDLQYEYAPWVTYREKARTGKFVNVDPAGFRSDGRPASLSDSGKKIFLFGGSTMFGYGVADNETIAAHLQRLMDKRLPGEGWRAFNFGRGGYYSTQETALFQDLLRQGFKADRVVFFDGLNEGKRFPHYSQDLASYFETHNYRKDGLFSDWVKTLPLYWISTHYLGRIFLTTPPGQKDFTEVESSRNELVFNREVSRALGRQYGVEVHHVLQPVPGFRNAFAKHPRQNREAPLNWTPFLIRKMTLQEETYRSNGDGSLADAFSNFPGLPFVDDVHYSAEANRLLAEGLYNLVFGAGGGSKNDINPLPKRDSVGRTIRTVGE